MTVWLYPSGDTFVVFNNEPDIEGAIVLDALPEGVGILRRRDDGTFYYESVLEPVDPNPEPEPEPVPPVETSIEKRLEQIELTSAYTQLQVDYVAFLTEILTTQPK
ncbi:hypothetical protein ACQKNX_02365 [Lysinibacillus sp. NPDC093712]|uniref:hypothetical protein n=1 Tax=Lysinibacillus sp. NPDC093712 TaxID=3390579 RepID=UPI003D076BBD